MMRRSIRALLIAALLLSGAAHAQVGQIGSGHVVANPTASQSVPKDSTVTALVDRAISSTQGAVFTRQGSAWAGLAPGTSGLPLLSGGASANLAYGILGMAGGGSGANLTASNGGIIYSGSSTLSVLAGTATARQQLQSGASGAPAWSTATWPATTTINQILYSSSANTVAGLATANSSVLVTSAGGIPSLSQALPGAVQITVNSFNSGTSASSGTFLRGDGTWVAPPGSSFATPTAKVGINAVAGVASSGMRSDASPPLDTTQTFTFTAEQVVSVASNNNGISLNNSSLANNRSWTIFPLTTGGETLFGLYQYCISACSTGTRANFHYLGGVGTSIGSLHVGDGTVAVSVLESGGSFGANIVTKTANYGATFNDYAVMCDATSGNVTVTLPNADASNYRRVYVVKKIDVTTNLCQVLSNAIDFDNFVMLSAPGASKTFQSDGSKWWIE